MNRFAESLVCFECASAALADDSIGEWYSLVRSGRPGGGRSFKMYNRIYHELTFPCYIGHILVKAHRQAGERAPGASTAAPEPPAGPVLAGSCREARRRGALVEADRPWPCAPAPDMPGGRWYSLVRSGRPGEGPSFKMYNMIYHQ